MSASNGPLRQYNDTAFLSQLYPADSAMLIAQQITEFLPYVENFSGLTGRVLSEDDHAGLLAVEVPLKSQMDNLLPDKGPFPLVAQLIFPRDYPHGALQVHLVPPKTMPAEFQQFRAVLASRGSFLVNNPPVFRGGIPPPPLLQTLLAVVEQLESGKRTQDGPSTSTMGLPTMGISGSPQREALVQDASEKVVHCLQNKATAYLDQRAKGLDFLQKLSESNRDLVKAKDVLEKHVRDLTPYVPRVRGIGSLIQCLEGREDTVEEHSACVVPVSADEEVAMHNLARVYALDDVLYLLQRSLKAGQLTCDEYVKCVSDVGREQFISRFVLSQLPKHAPATEVSSVCPQLPPNVSTSATSASPPSVPQRRNPRSVLQQQFPQVDADLIDDVLATSDNNVVIATEQLRKMFPA